MSSTMYPCILVTLGPSSLSEEIIKKCTGEGIYLFRINLSHTALESIEPLIKNVRKWTDVPICLDTEGAQIRNQKMVTEKVIFSKGETVKIHFDAVVGDSSNISFTPNNVARGFVIGDRINVDFDSVCLRIIEECGSYLMAEVEQGGAVGSNKAVDVSRNIFMEAVTQKDREAIKIGREMGIAHYALSFSNSKADVDEMRGLVGEGACIISKIETISGCLNLNEILKSADQILIDRGDLSRQVPIEKIPFLQRRIVSTVRSKGKPIFVATNLLESLVNSRNPTRAEVNDVISTLLMGANGLVLAAETAIGKYPVEAVRMIRRLITQFESWTPNTSLSEILQDELVFETRQAGRNNDSVNNAGFVQHAETGGI